MATNDDSITASIKTRIRQSVVTGDLRQLKSLVQQFPRIMDSLYSEDLVDLAVAHRQASAAIYLIVDQGFEVSTEFERDKKIFGGEYMACGVNEYHQTLEVLASAIKGFNDGRRERADQCYVMRDWPWKESPQSVTELDPEFVQLAGSGQLRDYVTRKSADERFGMLPTAHSVRMLRGFTENMNAIELACAPHVARPNATTQRDGDLPPR